MSWQRKILRVNLTDGTIRHEPLNMEWANYYLGGRGLATKYLWEGQDPRADALSPENQLIFTTGPLTGTMASTGGRYAVVTKGPLTNAIACSNSGGKFGAELKFAGYDLLILEGKSNTPVYLLIIDDKVELRSAEQYWGTTVWHTEESLKEAHGDPQMKVASIGVAGEAGVKYACIVNDLHRAAGRSGVGAVMGSKNLKAIAVRGTSGVKVDDAKKFLQTAAETQALLEKSEDRKDLTDYGTNAMIDMMNELGGLPTNNFQQVQFAGTENLNPAAMERENANGHTNLITNKACFGCTIGCGRIAPVSYTHLTLPTICSV